MIFFLSTMHISSDQWLCSMFNIIYNFNFLFLYLYFIKADTQQYMGVSVYGTTFQQT